MSTSQPTPTNEADELVDQQYTLILHYRLSQSLANDGGAELDFVGEIVDALKERCTGTIAPESPLRQVDALTIAHDLSELI